MDQGMDTGDIIAIERTPIDPRETYGDLQIRLSLLAAGMAKSLSPRIAEGGYPRIPQDHSQATVAPKITKEEAELSFERPARLEYNRFRAFTPAPGAFLQTSFGRIRIASAELLAISGQPGTLLGGNSVAFQEGSIDLAEIQPEGKKKMSGRDFFNGLRLRPGASLIA